MGTLFAITSLKLWLAAFGVLTFAGALVLRQRRGSLVATSILALIAAVAAHYGVFWVVALATLCIPWALFTAIQYIDAAWRFKTGFVIALGLGAALAIYPSYHDERFGKIVDEGSTEQKAEIEARARRGELGAKRWILSNVPFRLVRGLDLKGGLRLVYTVDVDEAIKDKRDRYYDELRTQLATSFGFHEGDKPATVDELKKLAGKVRVEKSRENVSTILVTFESAADADKIDDNFLKKFLGELQALPTADRKGYTFRIRGEVETSVRERAVTQAKETIHRRIDALGLKEPNVTTQGEDIIIEVPGDDDKQFAEIREIISQTARLEFKMVDDEADPMAPLVQRSHAEPGLSFEIENAPVGPGRTKPVHFAVLKKSESEDLKDTLVRLKKWVAENVELDPDHEIGFGRMSGYNSKKDTWEDIGWRTYHLYSRAEITGDMVRDAQATPDQSDKAGLGGWYVSMELTAAGGDRFEDITGKNVKRRFAIILDGKVESAPEIRQKIAGGRAQISMGSASVDQQLADAKKLELVLRSGALPAPISPSYDQRIGPSLGKDAIEQSMKGAVAGGVLVLAFMAIYYSRAGVIANLAVLFNLVLQVAILAMFGASMTLPGIAGLALTIGIAVDANVLINERIREELRQGKTPRAAVDAGYDKAFSAILDGHVTTLISGLILWQYGDGPIKGFAVTLIVGIAVSLFTGVVCTRILFDYAVRGRRVKKLAVG